MWLLVEWIPRSIISFMGVPKAAIPVPVSQRANTLFKILMLPRQASTHLCIMNCTGKEREEQYRTRAFPKTSHNHGRLPNDLSVIVVT
jgi:hypothetical protein